MSFCQNLLIELLKIIPFFIIGCITVRIALNQHRVEKKRFKSEQFERKYKIFEKVNNIHWEMLHNDLAEKQNLLEFTGSVLYRHFIFSEELNSKLSRLEMLISSFNLEVLAGKIGDSRKEIIKESKIIMEEIVKESKIE